MSLGHYRGAESKTKICSVRWRLQKDLYSGYLCPTFSFGSNYLGRIIIFEKCDNNKRIRFHEQDSRIKNVQKC